MAWDIVKHRDNYLPTYLPTYLPIYPSIKDEEFLDYLWTSFFSELHINSRISYKPPMFISQV